MTSPIGGPAPRKAFFQMVQKSFLSVLVYSNRCEYDIPKGLLKKMTRTYSLGGSNMAIGFQVGLVLGFWWFVR
jgi:hypothetical protein